ncbi:MAG: bifunctional hydroxymethylpyrimidine kinase/phosphomethylpyrimidine kinase [Bacteriovoracaceae bacterium]|nr:bifunctional hydroxymethylpyrimidine kinase/phosphomethylpyrimidine kinase [Bacteriovoracaceae bacterium]
MISEKRFNEILDGFANIDPILVVGDVGVDKYTYGEVNRISPEAPVPVLEVNKEWTKLGLAANVSDNLQSLNARSTLCSVIGDDLNANILEGLLEEAGLKTWGLVRDGSRMTTFKERVVTESQQICRIDYETKDQIDSAVYKRVQDRFNEFKAAHSALILEDYGKGFFTKEVTEFFIKEAQEEGRLVAVDPSRTTPPSWYKGATLLKPNKVESLMMAQCLGSNETNIEKVAELLVDKLNLKKIIITLGSEGMGMIDTEGDGKFHKIPTVAKEVFDVSGAGDTAISAIVCALASGASLQEAAWVGNCASGVVVGKQGTALATQEELKSFYPAFNK